MHFDVANLKDFYASPLGHLVRRLLGHRIRARWRNVPRGTMLGFGFACPYLGSFRGEAARTGALMPAGQGALVWPQDGRKLSVLVEEAQLPIPDNSVDRLLVVHGLEVAEQVRPMLREMWRVLAPEGRLMIVVPNRRGLWARIDSTPFGQGRPYSRAQLEALLRDSFFTPIDWANALHMPPFGRRMLLKSATAWERIGARISPGFGGVIIVEASKELMSPVLKQKKARTLRELATARGSNFAAPGRE